MRVFPAGRRLYAALVIGLVVIAGASLAAGAASAQAPPPPGPPGTVVNLCTGASLEQSIDEVAATLGVTRDELHEAILTTQQGAGAGTLQQVNTGPSSNLCSAQVTPATPSSATAAATPPGGPPGAGAGQITCTSNGSGQPACTGPGSDEVTCTSGTDADGRNVVTCMLPGSGQPPVGGACPPTLVEGVEAESHGPRTVTGPETCQGAAPTSDTGPVHTAPPSAGTTICTSSASAGVGIVTGSGGSTAVRELTVEGYDAVAQHLGRSITGEQVRAAFCTVRR